MKKLIIFFAVIAFSVFFISCGSTPKPEPTEPTEPTVEEDGVEDTADDNSNSVNTTETTITDSETDTSVDTGESPVDNTEALEKAKTARQTAIDAGANTLCSDLFDEVENLYNSAKELSDSGKDASKELAEVEKRYNILEQYILAKKAKKRIDENDFAKYEQTAYDKGAQSLSTLEEMLEDSQADTSKMFEMAKSAYGEFKNVIFLAYKSLAKEERTNAYKAKQNADKVRAGVAKKEDYKAAVEEFRKGDSAYAIQNPESAYNHYEIAKDKFIAVYGTVSEIRLAAEKIMLEAQKKVSESHSYAEKADETNPLDGDEIEGIEKDDAVLLEDDNYENPEDFEASITEDIDSISDSTETDSDDEEITETDTSDTSDDSNVTTDTTNMVDTTVPTDLTEPIVDDNVVKDTTTDSTDTTNVVDTTTDVIETEVVDTTNTTNVVDTTTDVIETEVVDTPDTIDSESDTTTDEVIQ